MSHREQVAASQESVRKGMSPEKKGESGLRGKKRLFTFV